MIHSRVKVHHGPEAHVAWVKDFNPGAEPGYTFSFDSHVGSFLDSFTVSFPEKFSLAGEDVVFTVCGGGLGRVVGLVSPDIAAVG